MDFPYVIQDKDAFVEKGSGVIECSFRNENGMAVIPKSIVWSLSDTRGRIMNSKDHISFVPVATTINIVLSGEDLAFPSGSRKNIENRILTIEAIYDSDLKSDLPLKRECCFPIRRLIKRTLI